MSRNRSWGGRGEMGGGRREEMSQAQRALGVERNPEIDLEFQHSAAP